jgi:hypothetical protein
MTPVRDTLLIANGLAKRWEIFMTPHISSGVDLRKIVVVTTMQ